MWTRSLAFVTAYMVYVAAVAHTQAPDVDTNGDPSVLSDTLYALAVNPDDYPDHASVYLFDDAIVRIESDGTTKTTFRQVVHILRQEAAEEWGEYSLPYYPGRERVQINWIRVLRPDGTVISDSAEHAEETSMPVTLVSPVYSSRKIKRITLGGVAPGTIVDFSYTIESFNPTLPGSMRFRWYVNTTQPVSRTRLMVDSPTDYGLRVQEVNVPFDEVVESMKDRTTRTWATSDIPAVEWEWFAGYPNEVIMEIRLAGPLGWQDIAQFYHDLSHDRYELTSEIRDAVGRLVHGASSTTDSLARIHRWIAQDLRYASLSLGDGSYRPRSPAEVYDTKFGDCKDKTTLFVSLARSMGLTAFPVLVSASGGVDSTMPSLTSFDHMIAAVDHGDRVDYVDLTAELVPYGDLPANLQGSVALAIYPSAKGELVVLPTDPPELNRFDEVVRGTLFEDGSFKGYVTWTAAGTEQYDLRESLYEVSETKQEDLSAMARDIAKNVFEGATVDSSSFSDGRDLNTVPSLTVWFSDDEIVDFVADKLLLPLPVDDYSYASTVDELEIEEERRFPIAKAAVNSPSIYSSSFELTLPSGWHAELPDDVIVDGVFGKYVGRYTQSGRQLTVRRELGGYRGLEPPDSIGALIAWMQEISEDRSFYLVLEPSAVAAYEPTNPHSPVDPSAILLSTDDLGDAAVMTSEGPAVSDVASAFMSAEPEVSLEREFGAEAIVFDVGESQVVSITASVSVYASAAEATKGIQLLELIDLGQMMQMMLALDPTVADQVAVEMRQELDLTAACDLGTGWMLSMVTPFMQLDMAICVCARGRTMTGLMAMGPRNKILEGDFVALLTTMDERIRSDPTLLVDVEGADRLSLDSGTMPEFFVADSAEGIALDMILPQLTDLPGSRISSESWDRLDEHPYYERSFEGRGFNFSLGESELAFLEATVTLFDNVPQALRPVAESAIESEAELAQLLGDAGEFTELLPFLEGTEMEPIEGLNLGIHSTGVFGRIRGVMKVDVFLASFTVGRLNVNLMAMAAPESARVEDFITLATHVHDRLLVEAPTMADQQADVETIEAVEQLVRVESDVSRLSRTGALDSALMVLAEIDTATTTIPVDGSMWNSLCWYGSLWRYEDRVLPACQAAIAVDSTNWAWRDSRGLALALTGDLAGAVADFEFAVNESTGTAFKRQRNEWIEELRAGNNPFTAELLQELRRRSG